MRSLTNFYAGCFFRRDADVERGHTPLSVTSPIDARPINSPCLFCDVSRAKGFNIVWEVSIHVIYRRYLASLMHRRQDESFAVFTDRDPAAAHHLLVIPKIHIGEQVPLPSVQSA